MRLHLFHFSPHGIVRAFSHLRAGRRLCRETGLSLRSLIPDSVSSMTAGYNAYRTIIDLNLPVPNTIIDIGANISQMTRLLLGLNKSGFVVSFEPNPHLSPIGDVRRLALSDYDGEADFFIPQNDCEWGTIEGEKNMISPDTARHRVKVHRMDSLIESGDISWDSMEKPIFVKIDTEGSEKKVIEGFGKYLSDVSYLLIEVENAEKRGGNYNFLELSERLISFGFDQCKVVYACYEGPEAPAYLDVLFWKS